MDILAHIVVWLNALANALGSVVFAPIAAMPGWLSATIVAAATGVLMLYVYKFTSNQGAIKRVRDDIKANLFALKLFKDNVPVTLKAQGRLFIGAGKLLVLSIVPVIVMTVPVLLLWGQMALWYQQRPLKVHEDAIMTLKLSGDGEADWPDVKLKPTSAFVVTTGPIRVVSKREVCWQITARENGYHHLVFQVGQQEASKEMAIGDGFMRVSVLRPGWSWSDALFNPAEPPFGPTSTVQSIDIEYPQRSSWTSGTDSWVIYWCVVSMIAAFFFRGMLGVNI
jgi:hypothetical protein